MILIEEGFHLWVDKPQQIGLGAEYEARLASDRIKYGLDWRESIRVAVAACPRGPSEEQKNSEMMPKYDRFAQLRGH
jgi:hypothetical protein